MLHLTRWARHALSAFRAHVNRRLAFSNDTAQAEQLLHALFVHSVDALYIVSVDHKRNPRFVKWNAVAARAIGQSTDEGAGKTLEEVLSSEAARRAANEIAQVVAERRALRFKQRVDGSGDEQRTLDVVHIPLLGP